MIRCIQTGRGLIYNKRPGAISWMMIGFIAAWLYITFNILRDGHGAGWVFLVATLFPIWILSLLSWDTLVLDTQAQAVTLKRRTVFGGRVQTFEPGELGRVRTQKRRNSDHGEMRVVLPLPQGDVDFGGIQSASKARAMAREINGWLDSHRPRA